MFINYKNKDLFIHIPKTAGTSITRCYISNHDICSDEGGNGHTLVNRINLEQKRGDIQGHVFINQLKNLVDLSNLNSFAVVRNPFELVVSHYHFSIQHPKYNYNDTFENFISLMVNPNAVRNPMLDYISDENRNILVKKIIRHENIKEDFYEVTGLDLSNHILNTSEHKHYSEYYNIKTRRIVEEYFKEDLDFFNYKYES